MSSSQGGAGLPARAASRRGRLRALTVAIGAASVLAGGGIACGLPGSSGSGSSGSGAGGLSGTTAPGSSSGSGQVTSGGS